MIDKF